MITQTDLKRLWKLRKDIRGITIRIRELELPYSGIRYESDGGHGSNVPDLTAHAAQKLIEKRLERTELEQEYTEILKKLIAGIEAMDDSSTAALLRMRYVRGMTWAKISKVTEYGSPDACRMVVNRYISYLPE